MVIDAGAFKDGAGNGCALYSGSWSFTVDTTPPAVESGTLTPANLATINDNTPAISFDFSEDVSTGTGTNAGKVKVGGTYYSAGISGSTVTVNLGASTLSDGSNAVVIDAGAFKDGAGNGCALYSGSWSFTVDTTPPAVESGTLTPANLATINDNTPAISLISVKMYQQGQEQMPGR